MIYVMVLESRCFDAKRISYTHFSKPTAFYPSAEFVYIYQLCCSPYLTDQTISDFYFVLMVSFFISSLATELIYYLHHSEFCAESYSRVHETVKSACFKDFTLLYPDFTSKMYLAMR